MQAVQLKNGSIAWMLEPFPRYGISTNANIPKVNLDPNGYAICRVQNIESAL